MRSIADQVDAVLFTGSSSGNLLINGAMQVVQRSSSVASITASGYYTADRFVTDISGLGTWTQSVENDAPTGSGFRKSIKMLTTTADASPAATDYCYLTQRLEGQNVQAIRKGTASAQTLTLSFWVKSNVTGTYVVRLLDQDNSNRMTSVKYSIVASGTWEYKTIVFSADTTGAFDNDANASLWVSFFLGAGTNFTSGTTQAWGTYTQANEAPQQVNVSSATNNYWQMTGAQLTVGSVAVPFEFKSYADDLRDCQRYYFRLLEMGGYSYIERSTTGVNYSNAISTIFSFPVPMRAAPVFSNVSGSYAVDNYGVATGITYSAQGTTVLSARIVFTTAGLVDYRPYFIIGNAGVTSQFLAEL
jgi:hypothetical protein